MKKTIDKILFQIENEIESKSINEDISIDVALHMIEFIRPLFEELRTFIAKYEFQDKDEEILFFKNIKPVILSKLLYFNHIYVIELRKPSGGIDSIKVYYKERLASITNFFNANLDFYQYYRSKASHLDKYYFLRGHENYKALTSKLLLKKVVLHCPIILSDGLGLKLPLSNWDMPYMLPEF